MIQVRAAVKVVGAVVGGQGIIFTANGKDRAFDAVGVAPYRRAEMGRVLPVAVQIIISQYHIPRYAVLVRHHHGNPHAPKGNEGSRYLVLINQGIPVNLGAVRHCPE